LLATNQTRLGIGGDADGFFAVELVLYRNSNYTKGYLTVAGPDLDEAGPNAYAKVSCTVTQRRSGTVTRRFSGGGRVHGYRAPAEDPASE
jgi:hypothetical protein